MAALIAQQLAAVIPSMMTQIATNMRQEGTSGGNQNSHDQSLKTFLNAKPTNFYGDEGATGLLQWFEKMEVTFDIANTPENLKVRYAASTFLKHALTWWNDEVRTRTRETILTMTWNEFKEVLTKKYVPRNELQKLEAEFWDHQMKGADHAGYTTRFHELSVLVPHMVTPVSRAIEQYIRGLPATMKDTVMATNHQTLQETIHLAAQLTDNQVKSGILTKESGKTSDVKKSGNSSNKKRKANSYVVVTAPPPANNTTPPAQA